MESELRQSKNTQLETLQSRLNVHGTRLWQLPFSYIAAALAVMSLTQKEGMAIPPEWIFRLVAILGGIVLICMMGAYEGYDRTVKAIRKLELDLGLDDCARNYPSHTYPYFALVVTTILGLFGISFEI